MTIEVKQKHVGVSGSYAGVTDETETIEYRVTTDDKTITRYDIMTSGLLPVKYQQHPQNPLMTVRDVTLDQDEAPTVWTATVSYSSAPYDKDDEEDEDFDSPLDKPARIRWTTTQFTKPIFRDLNEEAIVNSAGDYFDPPIEVDASRFSLVVEKNLVSVPSWVLTYSNAINNASFDVLGLTIPARTAKLSELAISEVQKEQDVEFYTVTFRLELANAEEEDWVVRVLDQGLHEYEPTISGYVKTPILIDGEPAKQPVLLNGSGVAIVNPEPTDAVYLEYNVYREKDFSVLPFA